jgi:hypothetical protein
LRSLSRGRACVRVIAIAVSLLVASAAPAAGARGTGGAGAVTPPEPAPADGPPATTPLPTAELAPDGRTAIAPEIAPDEVKNAIFAANQLTRKPYRYGGGHGSFLDTAYDCSGSVSYALHGAGLLAKPLDSSAFMSWGLRGKGAWITIYTNPQHAFTLIGGLRFDTAGPGQRGPRWRSASRPMRGFTARHPANL